MREITALAASKRTYDAFGTADKDAAERAVLSPARLGLKDSIHRLGDNIRETFPVVTKISGSGGGI